MTPAWPGNARLFDALLRCMPTALLIPSVFCAASAVSKLQQCAASISEPPRAEFQSSRTDSSPQRLLFFQFGSAPRHPDIYLLPIDLRSPDTLTFSQCSARNLCSI